MRVHSWPILFPYPPDREVWARPSDRRTLLPVAAPSPAALLRVVKTVGATNEHESFVFQFVCIRVHSWLILLSYPPDREVWARPSDRRTLLPVAAPSPAALLRVVKTVGATNEHESFVFQFVCIRVHSWLILLSYPPDREVWARPSDRRTLLPVAAPSPAELLRVVKTVEATNEHESFVF